MEHWQVAPGPRVTRIKISRLDADAEHPKLGVDFEFTGRRRFDDPSRIDAADGDTLFIARLDLTPCDTGPEPWLLSSGHVWTQDQYRGYVFTSRRESPEEYRQRTGSAAGAVANQLPFDPNTLMPLNPAIAGAPRSLIEARVLHGTYPPGYHPQRKSHTMRALPWLDGHIDDLSAYLTAASHNSR